MQRAVMQLLTDTPSTPELPGNRLDEKWYSKNPSREPTASLMNAILHHAESAKISTPDWYGLKSQDCVIVVNSSLAIKQNIAPKCPIL
jgi:hypothetical protein